MATRRNTSWLVLAVIAAFVAAGGPPSGASAQGSSLLERCWPTEALSVRPGERSPVRGAPGHSASIPKIDSSLLPAVTPSPIRGAVRRVDLPPGKKLVAITLDLCEQPGEIAGYDGPIFDYLRRNQVKATVFAGGKWLMTHGERAEQLIADPLIEIGIHGWAHRNVRGLEGAAQRTEIGAPLLSYAVRRTDLAKRQCAVDAPQLLAARPQRPVLTRFPYGACNPAALETTASLGLTAIQWDVSSGDATPTLPASAVAAHVLANTKPGSIILAHANGRGYKTAEALAIIVPKLKERGFSFVTVGELMAAGRPVIVPTCYDSRPGDTDRYDALFTGPRQQPVPSQKRTELVP